MAQNKSSGITAAGYTGPGIVNAGGYFGSKELSKILYCPSYMAQGDDRYGYPRASSDWGNFSQHVYTNYNFIASDNLDYTTSASAWSGDWNGCGSPWKLIKAGNNHMPIAADRSGIWRDACGYTGLEDMRHNRGFNTLWFDGAVTYIKDIGRQCMMVTMVPGAARSSWSKIRDQRY
jgi:prepilin-type processing-associated H-X9-DG protein